MVRFLVGQRVRTGVSLWPAIGRGLLLTISTWSAALQLFEPTSVAVRAVGDSLLIDIMNVIVLGLCALGWADVIAHDIGGRLLLPGLPMRIRHQVCVIVYSSLSLAYWVRAFVSAEHSALTLQVGAFYIVVGGFAFAAAWAIAREDLVQ